MNHAKTQAKIRYMVGLALLSAIVVVLQLLSGYISIGTVPITLVLVPVVVGAAVYGAGAGAFLGGVFAVVVLFQPGTMFYHNISIFGTIVTVLTKGILSGWLCGLCCKAFAKKNAYVGIVLASVVCPVVNTAIFLLGCRVFFWNGIAAEFGDVAKYFIEPVIVLNFLPELAINIILSPAIPTILHAKKKI